VDRNIGAKSNRKGREQTTYCSTKRPSRPWKWANDLLFNKKRPSRPWEWANDLLFNKKDPVALESGQTTYCSTKKDPVALESGQTTYCSTKKDPVALESGQTTYCSTKRPRRPWGWANDTQKKTQSLLRVGKRFIVRQICKKRPSRHWGQTTGSTSDRWGSTEEKELPMTGEPILGSQSKGTTSL